MISLITTSSLVIISYCSVSFLGGFILRKYVFKPKTVEQNEIELRKCQAPEKYIDAYYDCSAFRHPEWFSDKKPYHLGSKEDCKICKHFKITEKIK